MGKRTTIVAITALALLLAGIALAVVRLYRPGSDAPEAEKCAWGVLAAIPSDAAAVAVFDGSEKAAGILADSTGVLQGLFAPGNPDFMRFIQALGDRQLAVSLHNSGALVPLVVAQTQPGDSTLDVRAARAGLKTQVSGPYLLAARSETFLNAGVRQLEGGHSILGTRRLQDLIGQAEGPSFLLLSHSHGPKLLQMYAGKAFQQYADFVKNLSPWSLWQVESLGKEQILLSGTALPGDGAASFYADFEGTPARDPEFPEVLPYYTGTVLSVPIPDAEAYFAARRRQEDGKGQLVRFNKALKEKGGRPQNAEEWFTALQPREAVHVSFTDENGVSREAVLLRCAKSVRQDPEQKNEYRGVLGTVLGPQFAVEDSVCTAVGHWLVFADLPTARLLSEKADYTLKDRLSDASVSLPRGFVAYASLSDDPLAAGRLLDKRLAAPLQNTVKGAGFAPATVSLDLSGQAPRLKVSVETRALKGTKVQVFERDTVVVIPGGLFPVTNCETGKTNYLYQNSHLSICLKDENGKDLWGAPFKESFCGRVQTIDYYNNKKLQFLFCAGSKLYLMDRLGRWVGGFPVKLPKPVLLGPDVYDFTGAGGYTVMVLHKDNTLERYNLHGEKVQGWKGIRAGETVKNLPELLEAGGKNYWVVRTSIQTLIYPFAGGDPLYKAEGGKMLRPDARITVTAKGVSAECYDGKTRDIKLN